MEALTMTSSHGNFEPLGADDAPTDAPPSGEREASATLNIVHPELGYGQVKLMEPSSRGYLYVAASVRPGSTPIVLPSAQREKLMDRVKVLASKLESLPGVLHANAFRAIALPPTSRFSSYLKARSLRVVDFDVMVLVQTTSIAEARQLSGSVEFEVLLKTLKDAARHVELVFMRNVKRIDDVSLDRDGLFLFNHFVAQDPGVMLSLWDYLAAWYVAETGLKNSIALAPDATGVSQYAIVNFARWDTNPLHHFWSQLSKPSFWRYVTANLDANHAAAMPIYCRIA
jgi:hypothetical protein